MNKYRAVFLLLAFMAVLPLYSQDSLKIKSEYLPDLDGILKTKVEYDLDNSLIRFGVRNARFGAKGRVNDYMSYRVEVDLSDEGKIKMLDAFVRLTPVHNLDIYMGQRKIPFSTDYIRNPAENIFANRSFLAKYINDGMRDIGFYIDYKITSAFPLSLLVGAVNGTGNNNPQWIERPNLVGRVVAGNETGIRAAGNLYSGEALHKDHLLMFGGELRYSTDRFLIESEYIRRSWTDTSSVHVKDDGLYIHSYYNIPLNNRMISFVTPVARFDMMGNSVISRKVDASRITLGVNISFEQKQFYSELRFNYENYLKGNLPIHTDKVTIEFIGRF